MNKFIFGLWVMTSVSAAAFPSNASADSAFEAGVAQDSVSESIITNWIKFPLTFVSYKNYSDRNHLTLPSLEGATLGELEKLTASPDSAADRSSDLYQTLNIIDEARYNLMISQPGRVKHIYALLPDPPELIERKSDVEGEIIANIPDFITEDLAPATIENIRLINWLHSFNGSLQLSQAYLSPNWYQGGNNALTLLVNFLWKVTLNEVYHPNLKFENSVSYKLALNSTPQDTYHKYSVSEDIFQWNLIFGVKAYHNWFYSFTSQFKTQFLNTYGENSPTRKASFLSPGALTLGLGMTYSTSNKQKTLKFNASISPLSYNLNTCIDPEVDPTQYNVNAGRKTNSEIGSNAELTLDWQITSNIQWKSTFFTFSDYHYYLGDWENTFSFTINRFLSTQIYLHLRYDSSTDVSSLDNHRWRYWMLKEILSFGFTYTFSTK